MTNAWITGERLRTLAGIAVANALLIYSAIYGGWTLREVTLAYDGEFVILVLIVYARVLAAKRLPGSSDGGWKLLAGKLLGILTLFPLYVLVAGFIVLVLFGGLDLSEIDGKTWRWLAFCWAFFLVAHVMEFIRCASKGAFDELISDARIAMPLWRYPAMLLAAGAVAGERNLGAPIVPWFFVSALAVMAIIDSATQVIEIDAVARSTRATHRHGSVGPSRSTVRGKRRRADHV